ncbi:MAG: LptF/LptG family permease [Aquificota bacterium]|nr:LptF/LptG family permease [Aquificota bacterium]
MNLFDRYMITQFLKILTAVAFVSSVLILVYSLAEFLMGFRVRDFEVGVRYSLYVLPLGLYILFPLVAGVSVIILFRRVFSRNIDLTAQSFGISPLRFTAPVLILVLAGSLLFLVLNESFIPKLFKKVWYMERLFKKEEEAGRIVEDLWFVKTVGERRIFVYVDSLDVATGGFANLFLLITSSRGEVIGVVESRRGIWSGSTLRVEEGKFYSFREKGSPAGSGRFSLDTGIDLKEVGLFAEKIEHLRTSSLITLYSKGGMIGLDTDRYLAEMIFRGGMSFLSLLVVLSLVRHLMKRRDIRTGFIMLLVYLSVGWTAVIFPKIASTKVEIDPPYYTPVPLLLVLYLLKGVYDLRKGFRV